MHNQNNRNNDKKQKKYVETKLSRAASVMMSANRFKEDPQKLAEFIEYNITYFPNVDDEFLHKLRISDEKTDSKKRINAPTFAELDSENK
jgi:hypothetical protein